MRTKKIILIGIDGATFDIILPMIKRGQLRTFKAILDEAAWEELMSTYPPHTVPAWLSCATGVNPGKLGFFDFLENSHLTYDEGRVLRSTDLKAKTLWNILSEKNKQVAIVAIPMTYPPMKVNGIMVSPVRIIDSNKLSTYPPQFSTELLNKFDIASVLNDRKSFMEMHISQIHSELDTFLEATVASSHNVILQLTEIILYILDNYEFEFGMFMLPIDALQHHLWCFMDENHPAHDSRLAAKYKDTIFEGYRWIDNALEKILSRVGNDTTIMLVSDHGFGPLHKVFYANRWLMKKGLLKLKKGRKYSFAVTNVTFNRFLQRMGLRFVSGVLPERLMNLGIPILKRKLKSIPELIDWEHTKAYATSYAININLKGREPNGIVQHGEEYDGLVKYLKKELSHLKDPDTGKNIVEKVAEKSEIYRGPYVEEGPDVLIFFKDPKYSMRKDPLYSELFRQLTPKDRLTGHHTSFPKGICIAKGPQIIQGSTLKRPNIVDIAPTVLYLLGEAIPEEMDGRVLTEAITKEYLKAHPIITSKYSKGHIEEEPLTSGELDSEDNEQIKQRLKDLGYLG